MRTCLVVALLCVAGAVAWGVAEDRRPVPPRPAQTIAAVDAAWLSRLPADATLATDAWLARVPPAMRERGAGYATTRFVVLGARVATLVIATLLIFGDGSSQRMRSRAARLSRRRTVQDLLYAVQYFVLLFAFTLPVTTYAGFVRLRAFGFAAQPWLSWLADQVIQWAVLTAFYVVGVVAMFALIRARPRAWAPWATGVYVVLVALYAFLSPLYIEPLVNRIESMPDGPGKAWILSLLRANGVEHAEVYVSDASKQTRLLNAHVSGFMGTARVVVDDNTLLVAQPASSRFVLAHELGHYVLGHVGKSIVSDGLVMGAGFLLIAWIMAAATRRFGRRAGVDGPGDIAALPLLWLLFLLWGYVSLPVVNAISREHETEADLFGLNASQQPNGLAEFMIHDADTGTLDAAPLAKALFFSHPTDRERVGMAMRWREEQLRQRSMSP